MKVLMFGWEFPPFNQGGLGTACHGLCKGLSANDVDVTFVVPRMPEDMKSDHAKLVSAELDKIKFRSINSPLKAYITSNEYERQISRLGKKASLYGRDLFEEVMLYARRAQKIARKEKFDVIHAHDWLTYKAGIEAKKISKKPLVAHVHATEFDRTGGNGINPFVYDIEKQGMQYADAVVTVSNFTKDKVINNYGIDQKKIHVVHNAVEQPDKFFNELHPLKQTNKIVLFLGRITLQKGPDYFIEAAKKVSAFYPNTIFILAGTGDMEHAVMRKAAELGISDKIIFTGFKSGEDIDRLYQLSDVYVMPSVSEPFGITPLEAMRNNCPAIISKQSGVSEIVNHCLKVDFWDINEMANKILATLNYNALAQTLKENAKSEVQKISWEDPAKKCIEVYKKVINNG